MDRVKAGSGNSRTNRLLVQKEVPSSLKHSKALRQVEMGQRRIGRANSKSSSKLSKLKLQKGVRVEQRLNVRSSKLLPALGIQKRSFNAKKQITSSSKIKKITSEIRIVNKNSHTKLEQPSAIKQRLQKLKPDQKSKGQRSRDSDLKQKGRDVGLKEKGRIKRIGQDRSSIVRSLKKELSKEKQQLANLKLRFEKKNRLLPADILALGNNSRLMKGRKEEVRSKITQSARQGLKPLKPHGAHESPQKLLPKRNLVEVKKKRTTYSETKQQQQGRVEEQFEDEQQRVGKLGRPDKKRKRLQNLKQQSTSSPDSFNLPNIEKTLDFTKLEKDRLLIEELSPGREDYMKSLYEISECVMGDHDRRYAAASFPEVEFPERANNVINHSFLRPTEGRREIVLTPKRLGQILERAPRGEKAVVVNCRLIIETQSKMRLLAAVAQYSVSPKEALLQRFFVNKMFRRVGYVPYFLISFLSFVAERARKERVGSAVFREGASKETQVLLWLGLKPGVQAIKREELEAAARKVL